MYCLQLFARDSVSSTQCQLDTGNDQQNYARPTIQCISNYSNSTSTIEKTTQFMGHHFIILHYSISSMSGWYFHDLSHMSVLPGNDWKWHIFPKKYLVDQHCPTFSWLKRRIFHVTISSWANETRPTGALPSNSTGIPWAPQLPEICFELGFPLELQMKLSGGSGLQRMSEDDPKWRFAKVAYYENINQTLSKIKNHQQKIIYIYNCKYNYNI